MRYASATSDANDPTTPSQGSDSTTLTDATPGFAPAKSYGAPNAAFAAVGDFNGGDPDLGAQ